MVATERARCRRRGAARGPRPVATRRRWRRPRRRSGPASVPDRARPAVRAPRPTPTRSTSTGCCAPPTRARTCTCCVSTDFDIVGSSRRRRWSPSRTARAAAAPDRRHPAARRRPRAGRRPRRRAARRPEGARRARDAGRPGPQRPGPGLPPGTVEVVDSVPSSATATSCTSSRPSSARCADDTDAFDVLAAAFPAGTRPGAPKVRAMEIIEELEPVRRGIYGGAVGYFDPAATWTLAIAIRTAVIRDGRGLRAGRGRRGGRLRCRPPRRPRPATRRRAVLQAIAAAETLSG